MIEYKENHMGDIMIFYLKNRNKTIKELRKDSSLTVKELGLRIKVESYEIARIEKSKLKEIPKELRVKLIPIFRGDRYDNVPW